MIVIYNQKETDFKSIGLGTINPSECIVSEELNGSYELELTHYYDVHKKWERLEKNNIIVVDTPKGRQAFRIYSVNPKMESIKVNARHIFYDLLDNYCEKISATNVSAYSALAAIKSACAVNMPFSFETDLTATGTVIGKNINPAAAILSDDTDEDNISFLTAFGGEIDRDNFNISVKAALGKDRGVIISYRKNLTGLEITEDISNVATRVYPFGKDGKKYSKGYIDSEHVNDYPYPKIQILEVDDAVVDAQLKIAVREFYENGGDLPEINIKVDFQELSKTEEYSNYVQLEEVFIGDTVTVVNSKMNFSKKAKVISYKWDCLKQQYNNIELGDFTADITGSITSGKKSFNAATSASAEARQVLNLVTGVVTITSRGMYICIDSSDVETANKLFFFGQQGLQYSSTGVNGAWKTVINSEGNVV